MLVVTLRPLTLELTWVHKGGTLVEKVNATNILEPIMALNVNLNKYPSLIHISLQAGPTKDENYFNSRFRAHIQDLKNSLEDQEE